MDLSNITYSVWTPGSDHLTAIHAQSGLPTAHETRRTEKKKFGRYCGSITNWIHYSLHQLHQRNEGNNLI